MEEKAEESLQKKESGSQSSQTDNLVEALSDAEANGTRIKLILSG